MWTSMAFVTSLLTQLLLEFGLFILIDSVVKTSLRSVMTSLERCRLWLLESLVLLVLATFMSLYGSVTYVLYILAFSTMASSLLNLEDQGQTSPQRTIDDADDFPQRNPQIAIGSLTPVNGLGHCSPIQPNRSDSESDPSSVYNDDDFAWERRQNLATAPVVLVRDGVAKLASYFRGNGPRRSTSVPPGLPNDGMNLCFLNSVVQCLAHVQSHCGIDEALPQARHDYRYVDLIHCYNQLSTSCTTNHDGATVLDTGPFRRAASRLCPGLVVEPGLQKQTQQDAAEFLTWLLTTLQSGLKTVGSSQPPNHLQTDSGVESLSETNRQLLKEECLTLLQTSKSMYDRRCVKAVQVLSDLDWLEQQCRGTSVIDDVFCGQIIDLREDGVRDCVSIGIQAFSVLPVPLSGPRPISGVVHFQDCVDDMCALTGALGESLCGSFTSSPIKPDADGRNSGAYEPPSHCKQTISSSTPTKFDTLGSEGPSPCKTSDSRSKTSLGHLPKCLILQLNRFNEYGHKEQIPVNIPLHGLNLSRTLFDCPVSGALATNEATFLYDLAALCVHKGSGSSCYGHYIAYLMGGDGKWYCMDDERVDNVNMAFECNSSLVRKNSYLLFYVRRN